jgi:superfamily II DNA or RNA helicase
MSTQMMESPTSRPIDEPGPNPIIGREVTFVPGDPPRSGMFVLYDLDDRGEDDNGMGVVNGRSETDLGIVVPAGRTIRRRTVRATHVPVADLLPHLLELDSLHGLSPVRPSALSWASVVTAGLSLLARGRFRPAISPNGFDAWRLGPLARPDVGLIEALAAAFPPSAYPLPLDATTPIRVHSPAWLIRSAWDALADALPRTRAAQRVVGTPLYSSFDAQPATHLRQWLVDVEKESGQGADVTLRIEFDGSASEGVSGGDGDDNGGTEPVARGVVQLTSRVDPSLMVDASDLFSASASVLARFGDEVEEDLFLTLHRGARAWPFLAPLMKERVPSQLDLDDAALADLMGTGTESLLSAGIGVMLPAELLSDGLAVQGSVRTAPGSVVDAAFQLGTLLEFQWQVTLDGEALSPEEMSQLIEAKRGMVRLRGRWVMANAALIAKAAEKRARRLGAAEALGALLAGEVEFDGVQVPIVAEGPMVSLAERLRTLFDGDVGNNEPPVGLVGELRPYQQRGVTWLDQMCELGLGGCLADDMGLGKTVQVIGLHLHRRARGSGPSLVVCPTSLLGNWERELQRFAPDVPVRRYHGGDRTLHDLAVDEVVIATYGVVRRDHEQLADAGFSLVVADEAQHAKNPHSETARSLRAIPSGARIALSGTPVENRLSELWSILDWSTPGLLGPLERFRRTVATPIERYHDAEATERLVRVTRPFLLRRRKSDPDIAPELPPRIVSDLPVPLTTEQATLYGAEVKEALAQIEKKTGIERRGLVLRLLTVLKQICNHPAQYLHQTSPLAGRSGKMAALEELLDVILAEGESVLVFSQFVEMLSLVESRLAHLRIHTLFLHGATQAKRREEMVNAFQAGDAPVFLLSLKAGGVGLNLTRATHVVHFDRWWNPAVEDQATDRAHRIGQDRPVQVHRLITEGTLEDRIAELLERKRELAEAVIGGEGESWLTELSDADLADLVSLTSEFGFSPRRRTTGRGGKVGQP